MASASVLLPFDQSGDGLPRYLWEPILQPRQDYRGLHNTDPLIFDGFYYSNCKQQSFKGLKQLGRGSVMVKLGRVRLPNIPEKDLRAVLVKGRAENEAKLKRLFEAARLPDPSRSCSMWSPGLQKGSLGSLME